MIPAFENGSLSTIGYLILKLSVDEISAVLDPRRKDFRRCFGF